MLSGSPLEILVDLGAVPPLWRALIGTALLPLVGIA
jgi:hypothetical protein